MIDFGEENPQAPEHFRNKRAHFYKYMSVDTAKIVISQRTLRWSTPATLNDPYDMQFDFIAAIELEDAIQVTLESFWSAYKEKRPIQTTNEIVLLLWSVLRKLPNLSEDDFRETFAPAIKEGLQNGLAVLPKFNEEVREFMKTGKVLCLTESPVNPIMWAHYGANNTGVALGFRSVPALDSPYGMAMPMNYVASPPELINNAYITQLAAGGIPITPNELFDHLVLTKAASWSYEREWRVHSGDGRDRNAPYEDIPFGLNELEAVIFGLNTSKTDRETLSELAAKYPNAALYKVQIGNKAFEYDLVPLS